MNPMPASPPLTSTEPISRSRRLLARFSAVVLAVSVCAPSMLHAETLAPLPQGYTTDELPALPAAPPPSDGQPEAESQQAVFPVADGVSDEYADTDPSALSDFEEPLDPYGDWVDDSRYGTVWVPDEGVVGADFAPYQTAGHWSLTPDEEWIWVSYYDWGYIPFHYGRWVWIASRGWAWIPGRTYAPAWVVWRVSDTGYIGWAPMPPAYYWVGGIALSLWLIPPAAYVFCPTGYVFHEHVHTYVVRDRHTVQSVAHHSHTYTSASPSSSSSHTGGGQKSYTPASPSLAAAHIAPSSAPKSRIAGDPRAKSFSTRSGTATAKAMAKAPPSARASSPRATSPSRATRGSLASPRSMSSAQRSASQTPRYSPAPSASQGVSRGRQPVLRTPSASRSVPAPRTSVSSPRVSAPRSSPAVRAPTTHRPTVTPTVPQVVRPSAPVPAPSKPVIRGGKKISPRRR